jgi:hypothetical protein
MALGFDPYAVLGVPRDATDDQIAQARHRLVRRYHPDVNHDPDAAARFNKVQQAFRLLSDPAARAEYDRAHGRPDGAGVPKEAGQATGAAPRFFVDPASVNFGAIEPGKPGAEAVVAVYWTGAPPGRVTNEPGSGWWTVLRMGRLNSSGVVFHLYAQAAAGAARGPREARFRITLDETSIVVPLTAEIGDTPPPDFESSAPAPGPPTLLERLLPPEWLFPTVLVVIFFLVIVMALVGLVHH